jgi:hypothetical protein
MVEVDPVVCLVIRLAGLGAVPAWLLARAAVRWWSTSLTVIVACARVDSWCAYLGRLLRAKLPAASLPLVGGRALPTPGPVSPIAGPAVFHRGGEA